MNRPLEVGDIVRYKHPDKDEENFRFRLVELNGDRCIIEEICNDYLKPQETLMTDEIELAVSVQRGRCGREVQHL